MVKLQMIWRKFASLTVLIAVFSFFPIGDSPKSAEIFRHSTLKIETKSGIRQFSVEIADTRRQRAQGLQGRKSLPPGTGMLFDFKTEQPVSMWMKNTYISLDMLFIAADGTVTNIAHGTQPLSLEIIASGKPVKAVLEVMAGTAKILGIRKGDRIGHDIFKTEN